MAEELKVDLENCHLTFTLILYAAFIWVFTVCKSTNKGSFHQCLHFL